MNGSFTLRITKLLPSFSWKVWRSFSKMPDMCIVQDFHPQKVLILTKLSRLEYEKFRHPNLNDVELESALKKRGSDYNMLLYHHYIHKGSESRVEGCFKDFGLQTRVVNRFDYTEENIDWADLVVTTGGDGTFLMGASRIQGREKPIVGFNTDPTRSEGYLCLPKKNSINIQDAVRKLKKGRFVWTFRKRIRICLIGESVYKPPIELHDQQLKHPEYRFYDCLNEEHIAKNRQEFQKNPMRRVLPALALNEVYFGECVSARVSYFEVSVNGGERVKTKNAGLCVSTGTGSTSWSYNISKISPQTVDTICDILSKEKYAELTEKYSSKHISDYVTRIYNHRLTFHSDASKMLYTIRDPISAYTLPYAFEIQPRGFATKIEIRSRCFDASVVIDGGLSFSFNDGTLAVLEVHEDDALRTVTDVLEDAL